MISIFMFCAFAIYHIKVPFFDCIFSLRIDCEVCGLRPTPLDVLLRIVGVSVTLDDEVLIDPVKGKVGRLLRRTLESCRRF
jgi:hypothetical protein